MEIFGQRSETRLDKELGEWDIFAQEVLLMSNALWAPVIMKQNYQNEIILKPIYIRPVCYN